MYTCLQIFSFILLTKNDLWSRRAESHCKSTVVITVSCTLADNFNSTPNKGQITIGVS